MTSNDLEQDPVLVAMRALRTYDVGPTSAHRLRARCHRELAAQVPSDRAAGMWTRVAAGLAGAWSVVYLFETIRRAAVVLGF